MGWWRRLVPDTLKYRLVLAFLLLILLPSSVLHLYNHQKIEKLLQDKISEQNQRQLDGMKAALEDVMSLAYKTYMLLAQDATVTGVLKTPDKQPFLQNKQFIENKFISINNSFFLYTPFVYYTLLDLHGHLYTSYQPREPLDYERMVRETHFARVLEGEERLLWVTDDPNYVAKDISSNPYLLSLYAKLTDADGDMYGAVRVSIDYSYWFRFLLKDAPKEQQYYLLTDRGEIVATSAEPAALEEDVRRRIAASAESGYFVGGKPKTIVNYGYMPSLGWYMVSSVPAEVLFQEMSRLKRQTFFTFFLLTGAFIAITFMISNAVTRPLYHLQNKMKDVIRKGFKVKLPEEKYRGEILQLTRTYNQMLDDMNVLIERLKREERQKEAAHFQMLLSQMNPHVLLNTLNIIKWIALREDKPEIAEICISLGKLLETSLNVDADLIHVRTELEMIQAYIHIQRYKHKHRIECDIAVEEELMYALVPKLSIQPLVENAFVHGLAAAERDGRVRVSIRREQSRLIVEVADNGIGMEEAKRRQTTRKRKGIGLENVKDRIRLLFRDEGEFEVASSDRGTTVKFRIPLLIAKPFQHGGDRGVESADRRG